MQPASVAPPINRQSDLSGIIVIALASLSSMSSRDLVAVSEVWDTCIFACHALSTGTAQRMVTACFSFSILPSAVFALRPFTPFLNSSLVDHISPAEISSNTTLQALVVALDSIRDPLVFQDPTGSTQSSIRRGGRPPAPSLHHLLRAGALSRFYIRPGRPWHKIPKLCYRHRRPRCLSVNPNRILV
ncbi:hypothetical protein HD806DRAFT_39303 [Xylariaceae sp. AK1471]|nr:hypothetical protein HD806DRAFT_39303 [Xylariaceae sp. AK1471]